MKFSQLFFQTLRESPSEAEVMSHNLLMRAGFIRPLGAGIFTYLHLAQRSLQKIEAILREEMDGIGGQEICMPVVQPADAWKESGRWYQIGMEMARFRDRNDHELLLAMTHEEVVASLVRSEIQSYKQLPRLIYHIQTKFRDEPRPRAGLIRVREFTMKDSYSLDAEWEGLHQQYLAHYQAYFNIFHRCGLEVVAVRSDSGMMGGSQAHEYMFLSPIGEDTLLICDGCGYTANRQIARFNKLHSIPEIPGSLEKIHTPACKSIEDLANYLSIPRAKTAKAVFFMGTFIQAPSSKEEAPKQDEKFIFAIIRGDMDLNETKLANVLKARDIRPATEEEIRSIGAEPGFASPIFLCHEPGRIDAGRGNYIVVVDDSIPSSPNLVAGANEMDYHLLNTNFPRDYDADSVADIASAEDGYACPECSKPMRTTRGVEVGNIFKLGTRYSEAMGCTYLDKDGQHRPVIMGSYGIGTGRLLACIAEAHHDEHGLSWPVTVAPYQVHLVLLRGKGSPDAEEIANRVYRDLQAARVEVLFDDREESPGVKFNDADLIGLPVRLTISERSLGQGGVEMKLRTNMEKKIIPLGRIIEETRVCLSALEEEIAASVVRVEYNG